MPYSLVSFIDRCCFDYSFCLKTNENIHLTLTIVNYRLGTVDVTCVIFMYFKQKLNLKQQSICG